MEYVPSLSIDEIRANLINSVYVFYTSSGGFPKKINVCTYGYDNITLRNSSVSNIKWG
jgi:hypothetical protein